MPLFTERLKKKKPRDSHELLTERVRRNHPDEPQRRIAAIIEQIEGYLQESRSR